MSMTPTKRIVLMSLMIAIALTLNYFERFIPITIAIPGVKLGLANVVSLISLSFLGFSEVLLIVILRTVLSATFYGSLSALMFSLVGGIFSMAGMWLLFKLKNSNLSVVGISIFGAVCHNIGQVTVAVVILQSAMIYSYLPILLFSSVVTGVLVGIVAKRSIGYLSNGYVSGR